jgi:hypothetical protein
MNEIPAYLVKPGHKLLLYGEPAFVKKVHISPKGNFVTMTIRLRSGDNDMIVRYNRRSIFQILDASIDYHWPDVLRSKM